MKLYIMTVTMRSTKMVQTRWKRTEDEKERRKQRQMMDAVVVVQKKKKWHETHYLSLHDN